MDCRDYWDDVTGMVPCDHSLIVTRWEVRERCRLAEMLMCTRCGRIFEWQYLVDRDTDGKSGNLEGMVTPM